MFSALSVFYALLRRRSRCASAPQNGPAYELRTQSDDLSSFLKIHNFHNTVRSSSAWSYWKREWKSIMLAHLVPQRPSALWSLH